MHKLADLLEANADEFAYLESIDNGKPMHIAKAVDVALSVKCLRYYAGNYLYFENFIFII